ncbi:ABC-2 type transport system ATP-binding protein [Alteromonadaceae bacterium 2753L.S.0a.02]|nr:ABC-2 type transport system ATP-binding protein [Alteromonadaceae bacterium 2753L.S.0a.02]
MANFPPDFLKNPNTSKPQTPELLLGAEGIYKTYRSGHQTVNALSDINLKLSSNEILGIFGPEGSGKSTLIHILEGICSADKGRTQIYGDIPSAGISSHRVKSRLGVTIQNTTLPPLLKVNELLEFKCALHSSDLSRQKLLSSLQITECLHTQYCDLSESERQRVILAMTLLSNPKLLFLDEPSRAHQEEIRQVLWNTLEQHKTQSGGAILLATNNAQEAAQLCDKVLLLDKGRAIGAGNPQTLIATHCPQTLLQFRLHASVIIPKLQEIPHLQWHKNDAETLLVQVQCEDVDNTIYSIMHTAVSHNVRVSGIKVIPKTLDDVHEKLRQ